MKTRLSHHRTRAQESSTAIERMYITMRHLFNRGFFKPMGISGAALRNALLSLSPEIYGTIAEEKSEINGLAYVIDRLPEGITECQFINLTSDEGLGKSHFEPIVPTKRRRNCYRIDDQQMNIEITRGRSDIYDFLTHITFLYIEADKICDKVLMDDEGNTTHDFEKLRVLSLQKKPLNQQQREVALSHLANILGRSFEELMEALPMFATEKTPDRFFKIIYNMAQRAILERTENQKRTITFSPLLRERIGHHLHGELWAEKIKQTLFDRGWIHRPLHLISANMHSVINSLYAPQLFPERFENPNDYKAFEPLGKSTGQRDQEKIVAFALKNGMLFIEDDSGANIDVQLIDISAIDWSKSSWEKPKNQDAILIIMDYAFGEQAYETIDELLKPYKEGHLTHYLNMQSVSIMGKAGILCGKKGDIMLPTAHIFEGSSDNYPFHNCLSASDLSGSELGVFEGTMITVLGTSLQNKDLLEYFLSSTWGVIGLEMEGAHYQKAIQSASKIRRSISQDIQVRYAYYASDNPLESGSTLASGGLGQAGVKPTYLITHKILQQIFNQDVK